MDLKKKLEQVPSSPGIYIMKGSKERAIYVGKAKNLRNRLKSYFQPSSPLDVRKSGMIKEVKDFDYIVTENELEALVLEANFIKRLKPRFNIILRDDKNYPYLKLTVNEEWPRLEVVRRIEKDGSLYFGPYVPAGTMWEMLRFIRRTFPIRTCRYNLEKPFRPCVQYQMGRCLAPCAESHRSQSDRERYEETVNEVKFFLQGEKKELLSSLRKTMQRLSQEQRFEEAAKVRDRLRALEKAWESQRVIAPELGDMDVIGLYREDEEASIFMLFIRNGMVIGQKDFFLKKLGDIENKDLIASFIEQFYSKEMLLPPRIILPIKAKFETQSQWLSKKRGDTVQLSFVNNEHETEVLNMANENAFYSFNRHKETRVDETLLTIKKLLNLSAIPTRIEAIDVSNISGSEAVGALIVWEDGEFLKDDYRLFKIKTVEGIDDFAMIGEVVGRHLKHVSESGKRLPQLILIDGGKGQLESAVRAMRPFNLPIEIAAIAKARDETSRDVLSEIPRDLDRIYLTGRKEPIPLEPFKPSTHLLQKIRDEVHRFAISYHKRLRKKRILESPLERIKGIGKTRRLMLLRHFGSIDAIRKASIDEIASLKGMNRKIAQVLKNSLVVLIILLLPIISEAAYKVYLRNGRVISGVDAVEKNDKIKIYKSGILLELSKDNVIKIEEYEAKISRKETPEGEKLPGYLRYEKVPYDEEWEEEDNKRRLQQLKRKYQIILDKLKRIEALEIESKKLESSIYRSLRLRSPRKARIAREEKAKIDQELEGLRAEKDSLLRQKRELEYQISNLERE